MIDLDNIFVIILIIVFFECIGQGMLKQYNTHNHICFFLLAILCYIIVCSFVAKSYKNNNMGHVICIWSGLSIVIMTTIGVFIYNEKLHNKDIIGITLIILGIFILQYSGKY
jgi:small multidrug resistance pump